MAWLAALHTFPCQPMNCLPCQRELSPVPPQTLPQPCRSCRARPWLLPLLWPSASPRRCGRAHCLHTGQVAASCRCDCAMLHHAGQRPPPDTPDLRFLACLQAEMYGPFARPHKMLAALQRLPTAGAEVWPQEARLAVCSAELSG